MSNFEKAQAIAEFISNSNTLTDEQKRSMSSELMDECKTSLSIAEMESLKDIADGDLYYEMSVYEAEMGGFGRY